MLLPETNAAISRERLEEELDVLVLLTNHLQKCPITWSALEGHPLNTLPGLQAGTKRRKWGRGSLRYRYLEIFRRYGCHDLLAVQFGNPPSPPKTARQSRVKEAEPNHQPRGHTTNAQRESLDSLDKEASHPSSRGRATRNSIDAQLLPATPHARLVKDKSKTRDRGTASDQKLEKSDSITATSKVAAVATPARSQSQTKAKSHSKPKSTPKDTAAATKGEKKKQQQQQQQEGPGKTPARTSSRPAVNKRKRSTSLAESDQASAGISEQQITKRQKLRKVVVLLLPRPEDSHTESEMPSSDSDITEYSSTSSAKSQPIAIPGSANQRPQERRTCKHMRERARRLVQGQPDLDPDAGSETDLRAPPGLLSPCSVCSIVSDLSLLSDCPSTPLLGEPLMTCTSHELPFDGFSGVMASIQPPLKQSSIVYNSTGSQIESRNDENLRRISVSDVLDGVSAQATAGATRACMSTSDGISSSLYTHTSGRDERLRTSEDVSAVLSSALSSAFDHQQLIRQWKHPNHDDQILCANPQLAHPQEMNLDLFEAPSSQDGFWKLVGLIRLKIQKTAGGQAGICTCGDHRITN
ncbi:hypothetical protein PYCC9005_002576 [Savitreella phatthalungensis]